ncbi:hypothetical protein [Limnohabitans sp. Rim8]|uniref:hypothetical protein n=1 Tax=Limnohabitans sp. Rim8 TaxID=1100718 RepID=UPI0025CBAE60|nr:hypothetical protein [Limnohabitans sp. Rim8]
MKFILALSCLTFACSGVSATPVTPAPEPATQSTNALAEIAPTEASVVLNICRVKSIIRMAEAPDLYVNDAKIGELSNGVRLTHSVKTNDSYTVKTTASPLLFRFKDELLVKGRMPSEPIYAVIKAERNLAQGLSVFFGGAIAESIRQSTEVGDTKNWTTSFVTQSEFAGRCDE